MKKNVFIAFIMLLCSNVLFAQSTVQTEISFDKTIHDYGVIKKGANGACVFTFTNTGSEALILVNVMSSCGCSVPQWPKEPILPGKIGLITVTYDTNRIGNFTKTITVQSNASSPSLILTITGTVEE